MKRFTVTFTDTESAETEEQACESLIEYLRECVINEDVTAFEFEEQN
jgi:hypothetical protein